MGTRHRGGEKTKKKVLIKKLKENDKLFSRRKAENALRNGADPTTLDDKGKGLFTEHQNYHIRRLAFMKMGMPMPEDEKVRADFLIDIHVKETVFAQEKEQELTVALDAATPE